MIYLIEVLQDRRNGIKRSNEKAGLDPILQETVEIGVFQEKENRDLGPMKKCLDDLNLVEENVAAVDLEIGIATTEKVQRNQMFLVPSV